jgi:hypothetical protein
MAHNMDSELDDLQDRIFKMSAIQDELGRLQRRALNKIAGADISKAAGTTAYPDAEPEGEPRFDERGYDLGQSAAAMAEKGVKPWQPAADEATARMRGNPGLRFTLKEMNKAAKAKEGFSTNWAPVDTHADQPQARGGFPSTDEAEGPEAGEPGQPEQPARSNRSDAIRLVAQALKALEECRSDEEEAAAAKSAHSMITKALKLDPTVSQMRIENIGRELSRSLATPGRVTAGDMAAGAEARLTRPADMTPAPNLPGVVQLSNSYAVIPNKARADAEAARQSGDKAFNAGGKPLTRAEEDDRAYRLPKIPSQLWKEYGERPIKP